jgi:hypothetical protein
MARKQSLPEKPLSTRPDHNRELYWASLAEVFRTLLDDYSFTSACCVSQIVLFLLIILNSIAALALEPDLRMSQYAHTSWRVQDGAFNGIPTAIVQTADGYLWIGTSSGLMRFDGVRFVPWMPPPGGPELYG